MPSGRGSTPSVASTAKYLASKRTGISGGAIQCAIGLSCSARGGAEATTSIPMSEEPRPLRREREPHLLEELPHGARPRGLLGRAEPPLGERGVPFVGRASRERDVPGQEPALGAPLEHEHLEAVLGLASRDHRRRLADGSSHVAHCGRTGCKAGRRLGLVDDDLMTLRRLIRVAIADHGPITFAEFMEHALYGPGGFYDSPPSARRATS